MTPQQQLQQWIADSGSIVFDLQPTPLPALAEQAVAQGVETVWFGSRKELGHACGITVGAAAAAEL